VPRNSKRPSEPTGPDDATRVLVWRRCGGLCERCCRAPTDGLDPHHRDARRMGGTRVETAPWINLPSNLTGLCRPCHDWVEGHREQGLREGWLVRRSTAEQLRGVTKIPVADLRGRAWILTDDGQKHAYTMNDYDARVSDLTRN
jgi:hypothetical protein